MKLDIACGRNKKEGFIGLDIDRNSSADIIATALYLPVKDSCVDEIKCSHFLEHIYPEEAQKFFNEIFRVLKDGKKANMKVDRDWCKWLLFRKDPTHKYRYNQKEIENMVRKFQFRRMNRKIYLFGYMLRTKLFVELIK